MQEKERPMGGWWKTPHELDVILGRWSAVVEGKYNRISASLNLSRISRTAPHLLTQQYCNTPIILKQAQQESHSVSLERIMDWNQLVRESPLRTELSLPTRVVVKVGKLKYGEILAFEVGKEISPPGDGVCCLEVGGVVVAHGRIVNHFGNIFFKTTRIEEGRE